MVQSSEWSAHQDLQYYHNNFEKWEIRLVTSWRAEVRIRVIQGLVMLQCFPMMFVQLIGWKLEVQLHLIQPEFQTTIDASCFEYASLCHDFPEFYLQTCSMMLQNHELIKRSGFCLKKFEEKLREKVWRNGSRSENNEKLMLKTVRIMLIYAPLIMINQA